MTFGMRRKATVAVLPERLISEMLELTEDIVVIRALQTATRRPDLLRDLVVSRVPSDRRDPERRDRPDVQAR